MPMLRSLLITLFVCGFAQAGDWPQWLGPNRDGSTDEKIAPWKGPLKATWRAKVGEGHSSPVIAGGRVFLHTKVANKDEEAITAYDAKTGKILWAKTYERGPFTSIFGVGPRSTPTVAGEHVYTYGVTGILACWKVANGDQVWKVDTIKDFSPPSLRFGVSSSPVLVGDKLLTMVGAKGASIVAFNKNSGKVEWKSGDAPASYSSPTLLGEGKSQQAIFLTQKGVTSLNPTDGKQNWFIPLQDLLNESSTTPVKLGKYLLASSVTFGSLGIELGMENGKPTGKRDWKNGKLTCYFSTPIQIDEKHVYMLTGSIIPPPSANLRCVDVTTGKEIWMKKKAARYHAALLRTGDGKLLMLDDGGYLTLLAPNAKQYEELARSKVCGATWAHPALANGFVYFRDDNELICVKP